MKIGIITFHFVFNKGASLQCYALYRYLQKLGNQVSVINYRPRYHAVIYEKFKNPFIYAKGCLDKQKPTGLFRKLFVYSKGFLSALCKSLRRDDAVPAEIIERFNRQQFSMTECYRSYRALVRHPPKLDACIAGSDQIWNPDITGDFDPAYFLKFGDVRMRRISYAPSFGGALSPDALQKLGTLCMDLDSVSLREFSRSAIAAIGKPVSICADPTFLLSVEDYAPLEEAHGVSEPFIFIYGFDYSREFREALEATRVKYGDILIVNGSPRYLKVSGRVRNFRSYSPGVFLTLIRDAVCVVTGSFHATVFSCRYHTDFIAVPHSRTGGRITELAEALHMNNRIWNSNDTIFSQTIDWFAVETEILRIQKTSAEFLSNALYSENGCQSGFTADTLPKIPIGQQVYSGYLTEKSKLLRSASGGAAYALGCAVIANGGCVFGAVMTEDCRGTRYSYITDKAELSEICGSKYTVASKYVFHNGEKKPLYRMVRDVLTDGRTVLFIGLGCDIAMLKLFLGEYTYSGILYTVDLICHGTARNEVQRLFVAELERKFKSTIKTLNFRHKTEGWTPPHLRAEFENKKIYDRRLYETDFGFALNLCLRECCFSCPYKGNAHPADITIGDFWGMKKTDRRYNESGVSVLFLHTEKGQQLLQMADRKDFALSEADYTSAVAHNPSYVTATEKKEEYEDFIRNLGRYGLHGAVKRSPSYKNLLKLRIKHIIMTIFSR